MPCEPAPRASRQPLDVVIDEPDHDGWGEGGFSQMVTNAQGRHIGELVWLPHDRRFSTGLLLLAGWNVLADFDQHGDLAPDLRKTRIRGLQTQRAAVRALLAQIERNGIDLVTWRLRVAIERARPDRTWYR